MSPTMYFLIGDIFEYTTYTKGGIFERDQFYPYSRNVPVQSNPAARLATAYYGYSINCATNNYCKETNCVVYSAV